jgi:hypothetical protein
MVVTTTHSSQPLSPELREALEAVSLTDDQLKELITFEAAQLNMGFDDAVQAARNNTLPKTPLGFDLRFLVRMLDS